MEALDLRDNLLDYIKNKADYRFLKMLNALVKTYHEDTAMRDTIEEYNADIDEAIKEIENGEFYTQEEARKIASQW